MLKIMLNDNPEYIDKACEVLQTIEMNFLNFVVLKTFLKIRFELTGMFTTYSTGQYSGDRLSEIFHYGETLV